ncbi:hypothetical protein B0H17DRAFT_1051645 [Mycena rosella]|uniref:Uncharacterized protein n=1 Tax=Mycena rosella TaxID=1033263 RepID=A0AAD7GNN8_MYCRO|nr:hypothetical protein B0H17DRAFT_1051645 [Mycena rosella]
MGSSKTRKALKYTYAERVLGSFSLIQREHKKHAIHLASLRVQVQKTANARKDKLGPHWKNWVGKAVHRLEEDGILASSEAAGTVALTPNGKKAISAARRILALPTTDSLSPDQEDLLWKQVTRQNPGQAVKRVRSASDDDENSDDDEPDYVPPKSRKRARTSVTASKNVDPTYKLTKAQLVEELAILKRAREADMLRAASPLTVLDDDESEELLRLKETLKDKDDEVHALRRKLAGRNDEDPSDVLIPPPMRSDRHTVIRTQSGSFIDRLSKQPTPAPTERDPNDYNDDDMFNELDFVSVSVLPSSSAHSLVTPEATPLKNNPKAHFDKVSSLERALQLRATELQNLEHKLSQVESQHAESQLLLSSRDARISTLQTNLSSYESQISEKNGVIALQSSQISVLERAKADLEVSIREKTTEFERLLRERDDAIASLKNEQQIELTRLRQDLSDSEHVVAAHVAEIQTARTHVAFLDTSIANLGVEHDSQMTALLAERTRLEAALAEQSRAAASSDEAKQTLLMRIVELERRIEAHGGVELALKEELSLSAAELSTRSERLVAAEAQNHRLTTQLKDATEKYSAAQDGLADARAAAEALRPQIAALDDALMTRISSNRELQERLSKTQREADTFRLKINLLETSLGAAHANLETKQTEAEQLARELAAREKANEGLTLSMQEREQRLSEAVEAKEGFQTALDEVTLQLQHARLAEGELRAARELLADQLAAANAAKTSLIAELAATSAVVEATAAKLQESESTEARLKTEATGRDCEIQQLRVQLGESMERVHKMEQALAAAEAKYGSDIAERASVRIALEGMLASVRGDVERLTAELISAQENHNDVERCLRNEVRAITDTLDAAKLRGNLIEAARVDAVARAQDVEEELLELQASKDADAATIQGLKDVFSQLKATQMQSLAQLDNKLESTHSSPVPRRRASKVPAGSA